MKKIMMMLAAVLCCTMTTVFTACGNQDNTVTKEMSADSTAIEINLDSIVINPYMVFGSSLADVEKYMADNFSDYSDENPDSLVYYDFEEGPSWAKNYEKGKCKLGFYFGNEDGNDLKLVAYDFFFPMSLEPVMAELERNGFVNKGEIKFDDFNADLTYLFLSADGTIEVQVSTWEKDGGSWAISFQPFDKNDLNHLVNK